METGIQILSGLAELQVLKMAIRSLFGFKHQSYMAKIVATRKMHHTFWSPEQYKGTLFQKMQPHGACFKQRSRRRRRQRRRKRRRRRRSRFHHSQMLPICVPHQDQSLVVWKVLLFQPSTGRFKCPDSSTSLENTPG